MGFGVPCRLLRSSVENPSNHSESASLILCGGRGIPSKKSVIALYEIQPALF
jgi:hypothetical protein